MDKQVEILQVLRRSGRHQEALRLAERLFRDQPLLTAPEWFEVHRAAHVASLTFGDVFGAIAWGQREQLAADETQDPELIGLAAAQLGTAYATLGDTHEALSHLTRFTIIDDPPMACFDRLRGSVWFNIATAHISRKCHEEALGALRSAKAAYFQQGDRFNAVWCDLQSAWSALIADYLEPGKAFLDTASDGMGEDPAPELLSAHLCYTALYLYHTGAHREALALCEEVLTPGRAGVPDHLLADACWIAGECGLAIGDLGNARLLADLSLKHALAAKYPAQMNRASDLRRRVIAAQNRPA